MFKKIKAQCALLEKQFDQISPDRKEQLAQLAAYIKNKTTQGETPQLMAICTHNSRRSHITQLWLAIAAHYYGLAVHTYSGGTEATAVYPSVISAWQKLGLHIEAESTEANPVYNIYWLKNGMPYQAFSKQYASPPNPTTNFAAIMVCTSADAACPLVAGADMRLALPYNDPKQYDGTAQAAEKYNECIHTIGREILFAFHKIN